MTIRIIAGGAGYRGRLITKADGAVTLPERAERRFVDQGVAEYVEPEAPEAPEAPDYAAMTQEELKAQCEALGIPVKGRASKAQLIKALLDFDKPPELNSLGAE